MINEIKQDADERMEKSIAAVETAFKKVRTGRAHPSILDGVKVPYYGTDTPLSQLANISVEDGRSLLISPWEKPLIPVIEKAIMSSGLGLNPSTTGSVIRLPMPPLTEETRKDLIRVVRHEAENGRVAVRNIRRDAMSDLKDLLKEKEISEDEERKAHDDIQKMTDKFIAQVEDRLKKKEAELIEV